MKTKKEVILGTLSLCMYLNACSTLENKEGNLDNVVDEISTQAKKVKK